MTLAVRTTRLRTVLAVAVAVAGLSAARAEAPHAAAADPAPKLAVLELRLGGQVFATTPSYLDGFEQAFAPCGMPILSHRDLPAAAGTLLPTLLDKADLEATMKALRWFEQVHDTFHPVDLSPLRTLWKRLPFRLATGEHALAGHLLTALVALRSDDRALANEVLDATARALGDDPRIHEDNYHPEVVAAFRARLAALASEPRAHLTIDCRPGLTLIVNGRTRPETGPATLALAVGPTWVAVARDGVPAFEHRVELTAGADATIALDYDFERALFVDGPSLGLDFRTREAAARLVPDYAARIARAAGATHALVAGVVAWDGDPRLQYYLVDAERGAVVRSHAFALDSADRVDRHRAQQLARSMLYGDPRGCAAPPAAPWYDDPGGWALTAAGLVGAAIGTALWASDDHTAAGVTWGVSLVALTAGIATLASDDDDDADDDVPIRSAPNAR